MMRNLIPLIFLSAAVSLAADPVEPKMEPLVASTKDWEGKTLPPYPTTGQPELTIIRVTIPPKSQLPVHKHPVYNAVYVQEGQLTIIMPGQDDTLELKAGEAFVEVMNKWHFGRNDGDVPTVIILFYAGLEGTPVTILQDQEPGKPVAE